MTDYLSEFKERYSLSDVLAFLDRCAKLTPVVIGEAIIDEYTFCDSLGTANKEPVLAVLQRHTETYAGGALAVANHVAGLCDKVRLVTQLGEADSQLDFIRAALRHNVQADYLTQPGAPTITKHRFLDRYSSAKMFEVYGMDDAPQLNTPYMEDLKRILDEALPTSNLIIAADFGHGFFIDRLIRRLWASGCFLALNVQSNAGNRGYNVVSKWQRADYVCLANHEISLEVRQHDGEPRAKLLEVVKRIACPTWTVTVGRDGLIHYHVGDGTFWEAPALAKTVVDRIGAGDCVFAVTSLLVRLGAPPDIICFLGNAAGAFKAAHLGNSTPLQRHTFGKFIEELMA